MKCTNWVNWNKLIETQRNWNQWAGMKELKQSNWHEWMNEWMNERMNECRKEGMNEWMNPWMNEWMTEWQWMEGCMNAWMNEGMNECMNEWMHEWMHEPKVIRAPRFFTRDFSNLNSRIPDLLRLQLRDDEFAWWCGWHHGDITMMWLTFETGLSLQSCAPFADLIFQKCSKPESFLTSCAFSRPHLPKMLRTRQFLHVHQVEIELSIQSRDMLSIVQKFSKPDIFLTLLIWNRALTIPVRILWTSPDPWNRALATVLCKFCRPLPQSSRKTPETETLLRRPAATLPEIIEGFAPENVFKIFQAWIHAFPISHASQLLLTWWCGCHDDCGDDVVAITVRKLAMTIVRNSEVS